MHTNTRLLSGYVYQSNYRQSAIIVLFVFLVLGPTPFELRQICVPSEETPAVIITTNVTIKCYVCDNL